MWALKRRLAGGRGSRTVCMAFISPRFASVGRDCCIYQNVTIGEIGRAAPRIGDRCLIGAGAILVGGITIGSDVKVGAGAVVHTDVPDGSTVVPGAARILKKERGA